MKEKVFLSDKRIVSGLYVTIDQRKIKTNNKRFNIEINFPIKWSKRSHKVIISNSINGFAYLQLLVQENLCVKTIEQMSIDIFSQEEKEIILKAYDLLKPRSLRELIS